MYTTTNHRPGPNSSVVPMTTIVALTPSIPPHHLTLSLFHQTIRLSPYSHLVLSPLSRLFGYPHVAIRLYPLQNHTKSYSSCTSTTALDKLRQVKLFGRLHKCEFLKDRVDYLGFEVNREGMHTSPRKVKAILDWPRP